MLYKKILPSAFLVTAIGSIGFLTFQLPFILACVPQLQQRNRLVPSTNGILLEDRLGFQTEIACANVTEIVTIPKCFDPILYSYGFCTDEVVAESYKAFGLALDKNAVRLNTNARLLNDFDASWNPSLLKRATSWCEENHFYDPETAKVFMNKNDALDFVTWFMTFMIGGFMGILIISSFGFEIGILLVAIGILAFFFEMIIQCGIFISHQWSQWSPVTKEKPVKVDFPEASPPPYVVEE